MALNSSDRVQLKRISNGTSFQNVKWVLILIDPIRKWQPLAELKFRIFTFETTYDFSRLTADWQSNTSSPILWIVTQQPIYGLFMRKLSFVDLNWLQHSP